MSVLLFDVFNGYSIVKKKIVKGMRNIYYNVTITDVLKTCRKSKFSEGKFEEMH